MFVKQFTKKKMIIISQNEILPQTQTSGIYFIKVPKPSELWNELDIKNLLIAPILDKVVQILNNGLSHYIYCDEPLIIYYLTILKVNSQLNFKLLINFNNKVLEVL